MFLGEVKDVLSRIDSIHIWHILVHHYQFVHCLTSQPTIAHLSNSVGSIGDQKVLQLVLLKNAYKCIRAVYVVLDDQDMCLKVIKLQYTMILPKIFP